jgi:hypothetical protein
MLARVMEPERTSRGFWEIVLLDPTSHQEYLASILFYPFTFLLIKGVLFWYLVASSFVDNGEIKKIFSFIDNFS